MKKYWKHFLIPYVIFAIITFVFLGMMIIKNQKTIYIRNNSMCTTFQRVFDYAELLTDEEEAELEALIAETEQRVGADIVIVNIDYSLESFAHSYYPDAPIEDYIMIYADEFYEQNMFGYNEPYGDGVILVDNRCREADGYLYDWMGTTGKVEWKYSDEMIDEIFWDAEEYIDYDPYQAYVTFVKRFEKDMLSGEGMNFEFHPVYLIIAGVVTLIFCMKNRVKNGEKTTTEKTFLGYQRMNEIEDEFIRKSVTSRIVQAAGDYVVASSTYRGGGGHHRSSSGFSHGGGGHRR